MARTGKIARLPRNIRNSLNTRLDNGEQATGLVQWLNDLPEVQALLAADFEGRPINQQNLSDWKAGGFLDWQRTQQSCDSIRDLFEHADDLESAADDYQIPDRLASILAAELAEETRRLLASTTDPKERWRYLSDALRHLNTLRMGDRLAARSALDRFHLEIESHRHEEEEAKKESSRLRDQLTKPIINGMRRKTLATMFGGGEQGEQLADYLQRVEDLCQHPNSPPPDQT
jgi:hypothetical protein